MLENSDTFVVYKAGQGPGPLVVFLHGGGFSGLTWAVLTSELITKVEAKVAAIDLRGHGDTTTSDDLNLSIDKLSEDVCSVVNKLVGGETERPGVLLVGHSMGGALAVHVALLDQIQNLLGICVIDVVEGTAMDALASMPTFLRSRPAKFKSLDYAIEWSVRSGQVRNTESARVSMPGQLKSLSTGKCATQDANHPPAQVGVSSSSNLPPTVTPFSGNEAIAEEEEEEVGTKSATHVPKDSQTETNAHPGYTWRIDLASTDAHWPGWFTGLSSKFLSVPGAKLLLLAGVDRLDRELTVGQMQGKFQMQVLPQAGHAVHEDVPEKVADVLATFLVRNKFSEPKDNFSRTFPAC